MSERKLHDYQLVGKDFLQGRPRAGLFLDMGLGKTATTLTALKPEHFPVLVVAPKRVASDVWPLERDLWRPDLSLALAAGLPARRHAALESDKDIVVISRDNLRDLLRVKRKVPFKTLVIDELSSFKSRGVRWKALRKIIKLHKIEHRWGLTGTPIPNGYIDLWSQIYLLDDGERLGATITEYRSRWFTPDLRLNNGVIASWKPNPGAIDEIKAAISDICLYMESDGRIDLPELTENEIVIELPTTVKRVYRDMKKDMIVNLDLLGGEIHTAKNAAVMTNKLSQITAGFLFHEQQLGAPVDPNRIGGYDLLHREKVKVVKEIVESVGSPVLVTYRYIPERDMMMEDLGELAHSLDEDDVIPRWNRGEIPVLMVHPASAGHGLNLQHGGHHVIWPSPTWSSEEWMQLNKRLHRQGQKHPVVVHRIIAKRTVDPYIHDTMLGKENVQDGLLAHLQSPI